MYIKIEQWLMGYNDENDIFSSVGLIGNATKYIKPSDYKHTSFVNLFLC